MNDNEFSLTAHKAPLETKIGRVEMPLNAYKLRIPTTLAEACNIKHSDGNFINSPIKETCVQLEEIIRNAGNACRELNIHPQQSLGINKISNIILNLKEVLSHLTPLKEKE